MTGENRSSGFLTKSDTDRPAQCQKMAISLKFHEQVEEKTRPSAVRLQ